MTGNQKHNPDEYPPGSRIARDAGCLCPIIDNNYGRGAYTDSGGTIQYWYSARCPIHNTAIQVVASREYITHYGLDDWDYQP